MVRIFIVYGKKEGESEGVKVNEYFKKNGLDSFLAAPKSPDVQIGNYFQQVINPRLDKANIIIIMGTPGLSHSNLALGEISKAKELDKPFVPYVRGKTRLPLDLDGIWTPVRFEKGKAGTAANLKELELRMWRLLDSKIKWPQKMKVTNSPKKKGVKK